MNKKISISIIVIAISLSVFLVFSMENIEKNENYENEGQHAINSDTAPLGLIQTISLPNVSGRIDHMDIDINGQRLFVAELGNNSVDVIDLKAGKRINSINELHEPQGITFVPETKKILVANGGDGTVQIFNSETYSLVKTISLSSDADNMHYVSYQNMVYVGYGNGGLAIIDPVKEELVDSIKLDGHPESFQISNKLQPEIFVNVPESNSVELVDTQKKDVSKWYNNNTSGNYPMALDENDHRLFVVYRTPSQLSVIDTDSGRLVTKLSVVNDADDIFYDSKNKQIYLTGGEGYLDVISQKDVNTYQEVAKIPTAQGGRTSLFVPQLDRLYIAIPNYTGNGAKIQVFETHEIQ